MIFQPGLPFGRKVFNRKKRLGHCLTFEILQRCVTARASGV
jgi:hypothetical protein